MRILHIYSGNLFGGIEAILISLARHASLGADRHEFALCFDARLADSLRAACAPVMLIVVVGTGISLTRENGMNRAGIERVALSVPKAVAI